MVNASDWQALAEFADNMQRNMMYLRTNGNTTATLAVPKFGVMHELTRTANGTDNTRRISAGNPMPLRAWQIKEVIYHELVCLTPGVSVTLQKVLANIIGLWQAEFSNGMPGGCHGCTDR